MTNSIDSVVDAQRSTTAEVNNSAVYLMQSTATESFFSAQITSNSISPVIRQADVTPTDAGTEEDDTAGDEGYEDDEDAPPSTAGPGQGWPSPPPPPPGWPTGFAFPPPPPPGVSGPPPPPPPGWPTNYPWPPPPPPPPPGGGWWGWGRGRRRRRKKHSSTDPAATPTDSASAQGTAVPTDTGSSLTTPTESPTDSANSVSITDSISMTIDPTATNSSPTPTDSNMAMTSSLDSLLPSSLISSPTDSAVSAVSRNGSNTGALIGGIVGGIVGAGVVGALAFFCIRRAKRKNKKSMSSNSNGSNDMYQYTTDGEPATFAETIPSSTLGAAVGARAFVPPATKTDYGPDAYAGPQPAPPAQEDMYYYSPYSPTSPRFSQPSDNMDTYSHAGGYYNSFANSGDPTAEYNAMPNNPYYANYPSRHVAAANAGNAYYSSNYYEGSQIGGGSSEGYPEPYVDAMPSTTALVAGAAAAAGAGVAVGAGANNVRSPASASDIENISAVQSLNHDNAGEAVHGTAIDAVNNNAIQVANNDNHTNSPCDASVSCEGTTAVGSISAGRPSMSDADRDKTYLNPDDPDKPRVVVSKPDAKDD